MKPSVGIVMVNWNLREHTLACLDSVFGMEYPSFEVIVVDNGSTDGSVVEIAQAFPHVSQLVNEENRGFAAAANQGIEMAVAEGCDYVLVLNNDTVVATDLLEQLIAAGQSDPQIGILSPRIFFFDDPERTWHLAARWHRWLPIPVHVWAAEGPIVEADFVTGCGMLLRRRLLEKVGAFDTSYFMYGEDVDICARARRAGYRVVAVPRAHMWHKVSLSANKASAEMRYWQARNRILVYRRYPRQTLAWMTSLYALGKVAVDLVRDLIQGQFFISHALRGIRDGLREQVS